MSSLITLRRLCIRLDLPGRLLCMTICTKSLPGQHIASAMNLQQSELTQAAHDDDGSNDDAVESESGSSSHSHVDENGQVRGWFPILLARRNRCAQREKQMIQKNLDRATSVVNVGSHLQALCSPRTMRGQSTKSRITARVLMMQRAWPSSMASLQKQSVIYGVTGHGY